MSLLEDVFLEDEAGEAQELERIIEGDEYDDHLRPSTPNSNENSEREDEAVEDKRKVDPSTKPKRVVKNPRFVLNPARLTGPRGIQLIPEHFKDFKFKGKGHEKDDLDLVLKKLEHWAYRLYPKFQFEDCLKKIETLGKKRPVMVHLQKIRSDQLSTEEPIVQRESSEEDNAEPLQEEEDEFDKLLQQQIEIARATPAPGSVRKVPHTPVAERSLMMPKATSSPSISDDQRQRMLRNRQLAEERRLARLKQKEAKDTQENAHKVNENNDDGMNLNTDERKGDDNCVGQPNDNSKPSIENDEGINTSELNGENVKILKSNENIDDNIIDRISKSKTNRSNVIDSSDEEESIVTETVRIDVHESEKKCDEKSSDEEYDDNTDNIKTMNENKNDEIILTNNLVVLHDKTVDTNCNEKTDKSSDGTNFNENNDFNNDASLNETTVETKVVQNQEINTENKKDNETEFEEMDVDFSEDF